MEQIKIAYIFPGQGAQYVGMGRTLCDKYAGARRIFDTANKVLGFDIAKICFEGPKEELVKTEISQPAILTVSIAALEALKETSSSKFSPQVSAGLSLGEYSALVAAESISFVDAVRLVRKRGEFMEEASRINPGKMVSVIGLEQDKVYECCKNAGCEIANLNCPGQIVISGRAKEIDEAVALLKEAGAKRCIPLDVSGPFHSSLMNPACEKLKAELNNISISPPKIPVISNTTADYVTGADQIKEALVIQVSHTTRWNDSMIRIKNSGISAFFELGPGDTLKGLMRRIDPGLSVTNIAEEKDIASFPGAAR